jgi:CDP-diacylglycerol--glycerol-3-phosphate 3-phosphatidyltransferase
MIMTLANEITILRIILTAPFVICMIKINETTSNGSMRYAALAILAVMAISDGLDGYIARSRKQITKLGSFLDPLADKLLMLCACILLASPKTGIEGFVLPPTVFVLIIGKDVLLLLGFAATYLVTSHIRVIPVFTGKAGTVLQLSMVAAILLAPDINPVMPAWFYVTRILWWSAAVIAIISAFIYIRGGIRYIEQFEAQAHSNNRKNAPTEQKD